MEGMIVLCNCYKRQGIFRDFRRKPSVNRYIKITANNVGNKIMKGKRPRPSETGYEALT
jgi:hypothetical protein